MKKAISFYGLVLIVSFIPGFSSLFAAQETSAPKKEQAEAKAQAIDASAEVVSDHPEIPEGVSCNDCHEMKLDAKRRPPRYGFMESTWVKQKAKVSCPERYSGKRLLT